MLDDTPTSMEVDTWKEDLIWNSIINEMEESDG